jgi:hypothetical protein
MPPSIRSLACSFVVVLVALCALPPPARAQVGSRNTTTADPPLPRPSTQPCTVPLFDHLAFADFSPKSFAYAPPAGCPGPWAKVVLTADFSVTAGRQFDRTANLWIGGANVYFGTTAEPSAAVARSWHVERDLTDYSALLATAQPGEADLGNLVDTTYTGILYGSATLAFYPVGAHATPPRVADVVLPLSDHASGGTVSLATGDSALARSFTLPTNVERAYLDVIAQSQGGDEFWYTCVPDDVATELPSGGASGFRETEVTNDGQPAGVAPVYPWIYTGGIDPYLWQPIPGVETLAFSPYRVDLTPFAARLDDGRSHEVAIRVFNANHAFSATATLLLYLDHGAETVTGALTANTLAPPTPTVQEKLATAADGAIRGTVTVSATRRFVIAGYVDTSHGRVRTTIAQRIGFRNRQTLVVAATQYRQQIEQRTTVSAATHVRERGRTRDRVRSFTWPLAVDFDYAVAADGSATQTTRVEQRRDDDELSTRDGLPSAFALAADAMSTSDTLQFDASGAFVGPKDQSSSQSYFAADAAGACYSRAVESKAGVVTAVRDGAACGY